MMAEGGDRNTYGDLSVRSWTFSTGEHRIRPPLFASHTAPRPPDGYRRAKVAAGPLLSPPRTSLSGRGMESVRDRRARRGDQSHDGAARLARFGDIHFAGWPSRPCGPCPYAAVKEDRPTG